MFSDLQMKIIEKITEIYENILPKNPIMLPHLEALEYFERLIMNGNIITYVKDGELLGFIEFWRITPEQFGKVCCGMILAHEEDLLTGEICLITRMYITPDMRNSEVFINMGREFLSKNITSSYFVALQQHKHHKPIQVYTRDEILKHYKI